MAEYQEKRADGRMRLTFPMQYQRMRESGTFDVSIITTVRDLGKEGISFFSHEEMHLGLKLRITFAVSDEAKISFVGKVVRVEISEELSSHYVVGAEIVEMADQDRQKFIEFLSRVDIHAVLNTIDLRDVMDVNFVVGYPPVIKKVGKFSVEKVESFDEWTLRVLLLSLLDGEDYKRFMQEKESNFVFTHKENVRFRVNLHFQKGKIEAVFRLISAEIDSPTHIGLPAVVEKLLEHDKGLILVGGRTGSGKTTTLASMVEYLNNKRHGIVVCVEQPIEYLHTNKQCIIKQREVGKDTLSFSSASRNALRQNPDVLVIGEILDQETMEVAITASETGALVLTSIHAPDTAQALDRVSTFFPMESQKHILTRLSLVLRAVITQELIPRIDKPGLAVAAEVLLMNSAMRRVVRQGDWKQIPTILQTGKSIGMQTMQESLERYYRNGVINVEYLSEYQGK